MLEALTQDPATGQQDMAGGAGGAGGAGTSPGAGAGAGASAHTQGGTDPTTAMPYVGTEPGNTQTPSFTAPTPADSEPPRNPAHAPSGGESPSQPNSRGLMFGGGAKGVAGSIATLADSVLKGAMAGREKRKQDEDVKARKRMTGWTRLNENAANDVYAAAQQPEISAILLKTLKNPKYTPNEAEQKTLAPFTDAVTRSDAAWQTLNKMQTRYFLGDDAGRGKGKGKGKGKSGDGDDNPLAMASSNDPNEKLRGMVLLASRLGNPVQYRVREMLTKQLNDPARLDARDASRFRELISKPQRTPAEEEEVKALSERRKQLGEYAAAGRSGWGTPHYSTFDIPGASFPDGTKDKFGQPIDPKRSYREERVGEETQYVPTQPKTPKVRNGWSKDAQGRTYSVLLDDKNQPVAGTENYGLLPPAGYGDVVRHGQMLYTDGDGNTWQIPTTSTTTHLTPGRGAGTGTGTGTGTGAGAGGGTASTPGAGAAGAVAQPTASGASGATGGAGGAGGGTATSRADHTPAHVPAHAPATPHANTPTSTPAAPGAPTAPGTPAIPTSPVPGAKYIGAKGTPADKAVRASIIKAAGDLRRLTPSLDSADVYMRKIATDPSARDARKDLEMTVAAVRAMNPGTVRLPDKELQMEIKAGSYGDRFRRWSDMAATGLLPDDQRQSLYQIIHDATTEAGTHAVVDWQTNLPNQPLPDHLQRFADEAAKRRGAGGGAGDGASAGAGTGAGTGGTTPTLPEAVAKTLKEGVATTLRNKQKWTLHEGKPVQVQ